MTRRRTVIVLWLVFAFVTWNVAFDRAVAVAAVAFTREQILRYQQGQPVSSIDAAFSPEVRRAALQASAWASVVIAAGAAVYLRSLRNPNPRHPWNPNRRNRRTLRIR